MPEKTSTGMTSSKMFAKKRVASMLGIFQIQMRLIKRKKREPVKQRSVQRNGKRKLERNAPRKFVDVPSKKRNGNK